MIYSAITGKFDKARKDIKVFKAYNQFKDQRRNAKIYKVLSHLYDKDEYSVWVDGNIYLKHPIEYFIKLLGDADIACFPHPERVDLYQEAMFCKMFNKDTTSVINKQVRRYKGITGLWACGVIIRRHTDEIKWRNEQWWAEICAGSMRDQISFPYVFGDIVKTLPAVNLKDNKYFKRYGH